MLLFEAFAPALCRHHYYHHRHHHRHALNRQTPLNATQVPEDVRGEAELACSYLPLLEGKYVRRYVAWVPEWNACDS